MATDPWAVASVEDADPWDVVSEEDEAPANIQSNPVRDALLAEKKKRGLAKLGSGMTPEAIGATAPETRLHRPGSDIPYATAPDVDRPSGIVDRVLAGAGPLTTGALEGAQRWNVPHNVLESTRKTFSFNKMDAEPTEEDVPTARDVATVLGGAGAIPPVGEFIERTAGPIVNPLIKRAYGAAGKVAPGALIRRALAPSEDESALKAGALLVPRAAAKVGGTFQDPTNAVLMAGGGAAATIPRAIAEATFGAQMGKEIAPAWARVGEAGEDRGAAGALQELPGALVDSAFAAAMAKKMAGHVAVDAPNYARNRAAYDAARTKAAANTDYESKTAEREQLRGGALQQAIDKASETKAPEDVARAAALKERADQLAAELDGTPEQPAIRPQPLNRWELERLQRPPKFGEKPTGGAPGTARTEAQSQGAGATAEQIGQVLSANPADPALKRAKVWNSVTDPGFLEAIDNPALGEANPRLEIENRLKAGEQPDAISRTIRQPGFVTSDGAINIMAPRVESVAHLNELLDHESTHVALRLAETTGEPQAILGRAGTERTLAALAARTKDTTGAGQRVGQHYAGEPTSTLGEEVLAHGQEFTDTRQAPSIIDRAVAVVRDRIRAGPLSGLVGKASDAEIRVMLARAQKFLKDHPEARPPAESGVVRPKGPTLDEAGALLEKAVADYVQYEAPFVESPEAAEGTALLRNAMASAEKKAKEAAAAPRTPRVQTVAENDARLAEAARGDAARTVAQQAETTRRGQEAEAALAPLEASRARQAAAEGERALGRPVIEQAQETATAREAEARREVEFRTAREAAEKKRQGEIRALQESGLGPTALAAALEKPLGPEQRRLKKGPTAPPTEQLPGKAPAKAAPPTVPPAAGPRPEAAPAREAPMLSVREGEEPRPYDGNERRIERERRVSDVLRKDPTQLTPEDIATLRTHAEENPKSGLPSLLAWDARERKAHVASHDLDGLKYLNDAHGEIAGNAMVAAFGDVTREVQKRHPEVLTAHAQGDEFRSEHNDRAALEAFDKDLRETWEKTPVVVRDGHGNYHELTGLTFSTGIDTSFEKADRHMKGDVDDAELQPQSKRARETRGERTGKRGGVPPGVTSRPLEGPPERAPGVPGVAPRSGHDRRGGEQPSPEVKPEPSFSMRGASAEDADRKQLRTAQRMIRLGAPEDKVRRDTGWQQGVDKRWRWEGADNEATLDQGAYRKIPYVMNPTKGDGVRLGDVVHHDSLYASYPELADVKVVNAGRPIGSTMASFNPKTNQITLYPAIDSIEGGPLSAFLHEMQHWVQTKEAFAAGGSDDTVSKLIPPEDMRKIAEDAAVEISKRADYNRTNAETLEKVIEARRFHASDEGSRLPVSKVPDALDMTPAARRKFLSSSEWNKSTESLERELADERAAVTRAEDLAEKTRAATGEDLLKVVERHGDMHEYYRRLAGEVEARQTQARQHLTPEQRRNHAPVFDEDIPRDKQIVDLGRGPSYSRRIPDEFQVAWEAMPGKSTTWLRGIHEAPYAVRNAFTADMDGKVLRDRAGNDRIAQLFGVNETEQINAPGYWKPEHGPAENNPTRQVFVRVPEGADGMDRVRAYAAARGYVLRQEGVGIHRAREANEGERTNGLFSDIGHMPAPAEYRAYMKGLKAAAGGDFDKLVAVPSHNGINLWTWSDDITPERLVEINRATMETVPGSGATTHPLVVDSDLVQNDWAKEPNGEGYASQFSAAPGSPDLQNRLDQLRGAADRLGREWGQRHGWNTRLGAPEPAVPVDAERLVGSEVVSRGKTRENLFGRIARLIDGRQLADMRLAAESGKAAKGWYRESHAAIRSLFGDDAERFTGLLAATSPQASVPENLRIATRAWEEWDRRGRPTDPDEIRAMFPAFRYRDRATGEMKTKYGIVDMEARLNNAVTALAHPGAPLSGDKVESFRRNLGGDFDAVTNDTWMAYFSKWDQAVFGSRGGYLAGSYLVRRTAEKMGWTPAEVQETVWTFFRELTNRADRQGRTAADEMRAMTQGELVSGADSFAHLVRDPDVQNRLSALGIDVNRLPDLARLSPEEAAAPAVGAEAGPASVLGRVAGRAQEVIDRRWAREQLEGADVDKLGDADYGPLKKIADGLGIPTAGRSREQIARVLQAQADPARYSVRAGDTNAKAPEPWDVQLRPPQVAARVERSGIAEERAAAEGEYKPTRLEREKSQPWSQLQPEADRIDLATSDEQWVQAATRKGKVLDGAHQMAINKRVETRLAEAREASEKLAEARGMSEAERKEKKVDVQSLIREDMVKRLTYVAMERASVNAGTAAGRALAARRKIQSIGSDVSPDALVRKLLKVLPESDVSTVADLHRVYYESPAEFTNALRAALRPGALKKFLEAWKAGLLSATGTHVANFTGNTIEPATRLMETLTSAGIDTVWSKMSGKPRERFAKEATYELRGQLRAVGPSFARFVDEFRAQILRGEEPTLDVEGPLEYQVGAIGPGPKWVPFDVGAAVRTPFRALNIADRFFKGLGYEAELYKLSYRRARTEGFSGEKADARANMIIDNARRNMGDQWHSMMEEVNRGMKDRVFQGEPVKFIRSAMTTVRDHPGLGFLMPFLKTPSEITRLSWQRSPMGFLPGGRAWKTTREYLTQKESTTSHEPVERGQVSDAIARPLVGVALATAFSGLAANGFLTGSGPVDTNEKKLLLATGWQPYSIRIPQADGGHAYIPYNRFEPISSLLGIVSDGWEARDERKMTDKVLGSVAQNFTNKLFWKGLNDMATAISSPDRNAKQIISSMAASAAVPAVVAKGAEAIDPTFREKRSGPGLSGLGTATARATLRRVPGVSLEQEPIYTALGEPAQRPGTPATRFLLPVQPSSQKAGTTLEERLVALHAVPPPIPKDLTVPKELARDKYGDSFRIELTDEERAFLAGRRREASKIIRDHMAQWGAMPEMQQRERAEDVFRDAGRRAERELWAKTQALRDRARALAAGK